MSGHTLENIPADMIREIAKGLSAKDIVALYSIDRRFKELLSPLVEEKRNEWQFRQYRGDRAFLHIVEHLDEKDLKSLAAVNNQFRSIVYGKYIKRAEEIRNKK